MPKTIPSQKDKVRKFQRFVPFVMRHTSLLSFNFAERFKGKKEMQGNSAQSIERTTDPSSLKVSSSVFKEKLDAVDQVREAPFKPSLVLR